MLPLIVVNLVILSCPPALRFCLPPVREVNHWDQNKSLFVCLHICVIELVCRCHATDQVSMVMAEQTMSLAD